MCYNRIIMVNDECDEPGLCPYIAGKRGSPPDCAGPVKHGISGALFVSESTVKFHVGNILKKSGCTNRTTLTLLFNEKSK